MTEEQSRERGLALRELSPKEQLTIDNLPSCNWVVKDAAEKAGFSPSYAKRFTDRISKDASLRQAYKAKLAEIQGHTDVDAEELRSFYLLQMNLFGNRALDEEGKEKPISVERRHCAKVAKDNADALAKHIGFNEADNRQKRPQIAIVNTPELRLEQLDEERQLIIAQQSAELAIDEG